MVREILFKAKGKDDGMWIEGFPHLDSDGWIMWATGKGFGDAIDENTLCQYTGLTDKNGNKIWENDIVRCVDYNSNSEFMAVVEFGNPNSYYSWGYQLRHIKGDEPNLDILLWIDMEECGATCEVIGTIFDNPELLGGADNG